ncbi:MAG: hypothetical protein QM708_10505 [Propioniciclava sp.]|uniref:hypothetical protein n=1 Tax=Propioniciclava sp. TaxID=2038686 RepID=UPI0039E5C020
MAAHLTREQIRPVKQRIEDELLGRNGVTGVDIAEKIVDGVPTGELSIVVYVDQKRPLETIAESDRVPVEIDGIKTDVQQMVIELQVLTPVEPGALQLDPSAYPTLVGGISMGPHAPIYLTPPEVPTAGYYNSSGTLGALVRDNATGATMALTNFHVAARTLAWTTADRMTQPSMPDSSNTGAQFGTLTRAVLSENVDGAVVTLDAGQAWEARVQDVGWVTGTATATAGMAVQKRGRTTDHTFGTVHSVDATVTVNYGGTIGNRTLRNQVRISPDTARNARFSDRGDSGSVIMDSHGNAVGLLFAGANDGTATFANPIAAALSELDITMQTRPSVLVTRDLGCPPLVTRQLRCFTRPVVNCPLITKQVICDSRLSVCTRPISACIKLPPTRPLCPEVTRPLCDLNTRICGDQLVSRACDLPGPIKGLGQDEPEPELDFEAAFVDGLRFTKLIYSTRFTRIRQLCEPLIKIRDFLELPPIDEIVVGPKSETGYGEDTGGNEYDDAFWAGYLAALEELGVDPSGAQGAES